MKIACIISCYNEEKNIPEVVKQIIENKLNERIHFVLVNNASTDNSSLLFKKYSGKYKNIQFIINDKDIGWGFGIKFGLNRIKADIVGWTHSDLQYHAKDLLNVLDIIDQNKEKITTNNFLIKGQRINRKPIEKIFSTMMQIICSLILAKNLTEINAQPVFINYKQLQNMTLPDGLEMDLYTYYTSIINKSKIYRINVTQNERSYGSSSWNNNIFSKIKLSYKFLTYVIKLKNG
tara:strand:+ start:208 stop:909 length:702 start_codon:yes stop_codon:yes gene_type:complete